MQLSRVHPWLRHAIRVIGTVGALAWIAHRLDGPSLAAAVAALPGWTFLVPVSIVMLNTLNQAIRLRWVLKVLGHELHVRTVLSCLMRGAFVGLTLPSGGGEIAKTALVGRAGPGMGAAISALVVVRITQLPSWILVLCWGVAVGAYARTPVLLVSALGFIAVSMTLLLVVTFARLPWRDHWPWAGAVERWRDGFKTIRRTPVLLAGLVGLGVLAALLNSTVVWMLLLAADTPISFATVLGLVPAADVLWCAPCKKEMPSLDLLSKNQNLNNLKIFAVNVGKDSIDKSKKFFKDLNVQNLELYFDPPETLAKKLYLRGIPTTILFNKKGEEFARIVGTIDFNDSKFIDWLINYN